MLQPYQLTYDPDTRLVCVRGSEPQLQALERMERAQRWVGHPPFVSMPLTRLNVLSLEALSIPENVSDAYRQARRAVMAVDTREVEARIARELPLRRALLPHQLEFMALVSKQRAAFNASQMGTGKTAAGWVLAHLWRCQRVLIVAPKSVVPEWVLEHDKVFEPASGLLQPIPLDSASIQSRDAQLRNLSKTTHTAAILNYDVLYSLASAVNAFRPDCFIFDESHRLKARSAQVTKAALALTPNAAHVLLMSGTPIGNDVGDLWSQLKLLRPELAMPYWEFMQRYARMINVSVPTRSGHFREVQKPVGCLDPIGLMRELERVWYRATKETCLQLPPKQYQRISLQLPESTRALYNDVAVNGEFALGNPMSLNDERVVKLRLQQIAGGHRPMLHSTFGLGEEAVCNTLEPLPDPKVNWLINWAKDNLLEYPQTRVLIWCRFRPEIDRIQAALTEVLGSSGTAFAAHGGTTTADLEVAKASFNARELGGVQVMVCQYQKMAFGQNLQAADYHIYHSPTWSYIEHTQSEDRSHRQGREGAVRYIQLVAAGTIDEQVYAALDRKESLAERLAPHTVSGP